MESFLSSQPEANPGEATCFSSARCAGTALGSEAQHVFHARHGLLPAGSHSGWRRPHCGRAASGDNPHTSGDRQEVQEAARKRHERSHQVFLQRNVQIKGDMQPVAASAVIQHPDVNLERSTAVAVTAATCMNRRETPAAWLTARPRSTSWLWSSTLQTKPAIASIDTCPTPRFVNSWFQWFCQSKQILQHFFV